MTLSIATYNIRKGGVRRRLLLAEVLRSIDADLVVLQEATDPGVVQSIARATGSTVLLADTGRSVAVVGRVGPVETAWHPLSPTRAFGEVRLPELGVRILAVHLAAGLSGRRERRRSVELDRVLAVATSPPGPDRTLIVGDLNAIAPGEVPVLARLPLWIRLLLQVDGRMGTDVIGRLYASGYADAFRQVNGEGGGATMPAGAPVVRLDYLMVGPALAGGVIACRVGSGDPSLLAAASDHLPVVLELDAGAAARSAA